MTISVLVVEVCSNGIRESFCDGFVATVGMATDAHVEQQHQGQCFSHCEAGPFKSGGPLENPFLDFPVALPLGLPTSHIAEFIEQVIVFEGSDAPGGTVEVLLNLTERLHVLLQRELAYET